MRPTQANTSPFLSKDTQKSAVFRSLGSTPPVHTARGDELKGGPQVGPVKGYKKCPCSHAHQGPKSASTRPIMGGKAGLLIRKHDHFTPTREIRRHVRALARNRPGGRYCPLARLARLRRANYRSDERRGCSGIFGMIVLQVLFQGRHRILPVKHKNIATKFRNWGERSRGYRRRNYGRGGVEDLAVTYEGLVVTC